MAWDESQRIMDHVTKNNAFSYRGSCNTNMSASATTIVCTELINFGDDFFNRYYAYVIKNDNSVGNAPEGEYRRVTNYVSNSGTFTVDAFSANIEADDEFCLLHEIFISLLTSKVVLDAFTLADMDDFSIADANADNERWNIGYISGTEGGSANIDTTTSGKLMIKVDPDASPTTARYRVSHNLPFYADYFSVFIDMNATWGAVNSVTAKAVGILISAGTTYDANNYIAIERQVGTAIDQLQARWNLAGAGEQTSTPSPAITDDIIALKIERWDNTWNLYYSTTQYPNYDWKIITAVEDTAVAMTDQVILYIEAYSPGSDDDETVQGDFDTFRYYIASGGGAQYIAGDYNSAWVSRDVDGSVFERLEDMKEGLWGTGGITSFPAAADIADTVSIAEAIRAILTSIVGGDDYDAYTNISGSANTSLNAVAQKFAATIGIDAANTYSTTIQGSARTTIETSFDGVAAYFSTSGAAWSIIMNNAAAVGNLETTWEGWLAVVGVDGANQFANISNSANTTFNAVFQKFAATIGIDAANSFSTTIQGSARTTIEAAFDGVAAYFSAAGAAWSIIMNNAAAVTTLETTWEGWLAVVGVDGANQFTNIANSANTTFDAVFQKFATVIGINAGNTYLPAMFGGTPATIEASFTALGTAIGVEYDGSPDLYDTIVTGYDSSGIASNEDGSVMERLEHIQVDVDTFQGIAYRGTVTTYTGATQFASTDLIGFGDGAFIGWSVFVFRDGAGLGAAPQQQDVVPISAYTSTTGAFTHTAFASGTLAVNDEIIIVHPALAALADRTIAAATGAVTTTDSIMAYVKQIVTNTYRLDETACADIVDPVDMTTEVADNTVLANIMTDDGDTSVYDRRYHSLEAIANSLNGATGIFHEQADTPITYNTDDSEDTTLSLATASTRYILRSLWLKFADPTPNTITVRLKLLINDVSTTVKTFSVTTNNFTTHFSLMDMFAEPQVVGDSIVITTQNSAVATVAVTGQYSYAKTNV